MKKHEIRFSKHVLPSAIFTDLDGTLLNSHRKVSARNLECLHQLATIGAMRVIATGRSLYSYRSLFDESFPVDFLIFSSGAGIFDLRNDTLLKSASFSEEDIFTITDLLAHHRADFMVHHEVPDNHYFTYLQHNINEDFSRRVAIYQDYAEDYAKIGRYPSLSAQIIAILPKDPARFATLKMGLSDFQVIRATSPLDHESIWLEIYPRNIHKGSGAAWLCERFNLDPTRTVGVGNDYNDLELLDFTPASYLLANGPADLQGRYRQSPSNDEDGFYHAIQDVLNKSI